MQTEMFTQAGPVAASTPQRDAGAAAGQACADKAERVSDFDSKGASEFIWSWLVRHGDTPGEILTDEAVRHGFRPHDTRAFGPVFGRLVRAGRIRTVGYCLREKGHATAGGRVWGVVR